MKSYNQEFKNIIIIYFDQSITSYKYILLRFIIYYYYYHSTDLHIRIPISLDQRIETYYNISKKRTKTDAIKELLEIGLFTFENWSQIKKEPDKLQELQTNERRRISRLYTGYGSTRIRNNVRYL